jgi:hypothetical protein
MPQPSDRDQEAARELLDRFRGQRIFQLDVADLAEFRAVARAEERARCVAAIGEVRTASQADRKGKEIDHVALGWIVWTLRGVELLLAPAPELEKKDGVA